MTGTNLAALVRNYTRTNSTTFPDSEIVLLGNVVKDDIAKEIVKVDEDYGAVPATRDLVASSTSDPTLREYSLPEDIMKMLRVEAKFNGTDWVKLIELNLAQYKRATDEATITSLFSNNPASESDRGAQYDIFRGSLVIYSGTISAVTAGLKLLFIEFPADIATDDLSGTSDLSLPPTTTSWQIPRQFHELWARRISILWKSNREKPIPLTERELSYERDFRKALSSITNPNQDRDNLGILPSDVRYQA